jgi:thermostable 8-oxoguanine DNA glycosylase
MKWHIAHRHEIPTAFDALGKDYDAKVTNLQEENALLKKKVEDLEMALGQAKIDFMQERTEKLIKATEVMKLNNDIQTMAMAIALRDNLIKVRLNIEMPNPFK